ncbi:DHS-like NAD/FAD-binding domain-containing protein [Xylaria intraflava]|nr:DHS-like NAD/FAD-binding domain-containing protein [Xylaria intraflava]
MPTLQVTPDAPNLLQNVADTLAKSRKIVIITGAGISTNSGIPDFRSENGLYSLIQDQFESAEANVKKESLQDHDVSAAAAVSFDINERPRKRRRMSEPNNSLLSASLRPESSPSPARNRFQNQVDPQVRLPEDTATVPETESQNVSAQQTQVVAVAPLDSSQRVTRSQATMLRPKLPRHLTQHSVDSSTSHDSASSSDQPLPSESSQTDSSTAGTTPWQTTSCTPADTPSRPIVHLTSSSPLSSPPPVLFDPYENASPSTVSSPHEDSDCSDTFESDDTQQSLDFLSSQASNSNLRNLKGRDLFDCNIWADPLKTSVFYRFITSLRQRLREVQPTVTHRFIAQMRDVGKLARVYTQNIDEIEKKIGLSTDLKHGFGNKKRKPVKQPLESSEKEEVTESPEDVDGAGAADMAAQASQNPDATQSKPRPSLSPNKGVECVYLHGSLHALRCFACGKLSDWDEDGRESRTLCGEQPECPHCVGATAARQEKGKRALSIGKLRPDIVLYGEEHPQSDLISPIVQHDLAAGPDLLLVLGTSLRVHGLKVMVKEFAKAVHTKGGKVVFINFTKPSESVWGDILDYWIEWDCDAWVEDLKVRKPLLWLSPDERLALDKQRRETLAEKKRESLKKRESINERKRESINEKKQDSADDKSRQPTEQGKTRQAPKYPVAMRNDYHCGAYVVWDIFKTLAKIGDRPFDNLGYTAPAPSPSAPAVPPSSLDPNPDSLRESGLGSQKDSLAHYSGPDPPHALEVDPQGESPFQNSYLGPPLDVGPQQNPRLQNSDLDLRTPQMEPQAQKKRNRKPRPRKPPGQPSSLNDSNPITSKPRGPNSPSLGAPVNMADINSSATGQSTPASIDKPPTKRRKARKAAQENPTPNADGNHEKIPATKNKRREKYSGKNQYRQAVSELAQSRRTPTMVYSDLVPATPAPSERHLSGPHPVPRAGHLVSQPNADESNSGHSITYPTQRRLLPPPSYSPLQPAAAPGPECPQEGPQECPNLPPLNANWGDSPPSIVPMEIAPLVGPASPLAEKPPSATNPPYSSYTWYHAAHPIYNGPLMGISRRGVSHKPHWRIESNDDNTPSPSDQLHMEAANQLWRVRGRV